MNLANWRAPVNATRHHTGPKLTSAASSLCRRGATCHRPLSSTVARLAQGRAPSASLVLDHPATGRDSASWPCTLFHVVTCGADLGGETASRLRRRAHTRARYSRLAHRRGRQGGRAAASGLEAGRPAYYGAWGLWGAERRASAYLPAVRLSIGRPVRRSRCIPRGRFCPWHCYAG